MKKNIIISVLAVLAVLFGLYGFYQKVKAYKEAERARMAETEAIVQRDAAVAAYAMAERQEVIAIEQKQIA